MVAGDYELYNFMDMKTNEFEKYLEKECFEANPTVLDDDMPDFFDDWLGSQNADDFIRLGNAFCEERVREERESKNDAYRERNMLVWALTKLFPAYLARHDESDTTWERDWMWIVYIDLPIEKMLLPTGNEITRSGQVSWHIHDSERELFDHLEVRENNWDGHNTERKYQRLMALQALTPTKTDKEIIDEDCPEHGSSELAKDAFWERPWTAHWGCKCKGFIKTDKQTEV